MTEYEGPDQKNSEVLDSEKLRAIKGYYSGNEWRKSIGEVVQDLRKEGFTDITQEDVENALEVILSQTDKRNK